MEKEQQPDLTKKERKEIKRQEREDERVRQIRKRQTKKYITRLVVLSVVVLSIVGVWKLMQQSATSSALVSSEVLQVQADDWVKGNIDATVTLVEYLDFECEACGAYYPLVKRLSEEYGDRVTFVSRYFPLPNHRNSMTSASAIEAAGRQGKYWEMHDLLFEEQQNWGELAAPDPAIFERYAEQLGLDMERFKQDVASEEVRNRIVRDRDAGSRLGISGTPTFFLNGEKIQNPRGYEAFVSLLEDALQQ
mgnify:CR=1 FL=1|tara:strand:+ start:174 stop:920 length:747 start_codon:yes stop_codon:yes gene_type:complete